MVPTDVKTPCDTDWSYRGQSGLAGHVPTPPSPAVSTQTHRPGRTPGSRGPAHPCLPSGRPQDSPPNTQRGSETDYEMEMETQGKGLC